jgi:hypothetical protein
MAMEFAAIPSPQPTLESHQACLEALRQTVMILIGQTTTDQDCRAITWEEFTELTGITGKPSTPQDAAQIVRDARRPPSG